MPEPDDADDIVIDRLVIDLPEGAGSDEDLGVAIARELVHGLLARFAQIREEP